MTGKDALAKQLGGVQPPDGLVACVDDADLQRLADSVRAARHHQAQALAASGEHALRFVPALLRRPVRKIVGL